MAPPTPPTGPPRRSRKEVLLSRKEREQFSNIRLAATITIAAIVVILLSGVVYELLIIPSRPIARVNGEVITVREWQARTRLERFQLIDSVETIAELFEDPAQVQQFAQQQIVALQRANAVPFGSQVLQRMIDEKLIQQEAEALGLSVSDVEVQALLETQFNYYDGVATREPTATPGPDPTPTITPLALGEAADDGIPTPTPGPTATPLPSPTPVSEEAFLEAYAEQIDAYGGYEDLYREILGFQVAYDKLLEALGSDVAREEEQASLFTLQFATEAEALQALADVATSDFLTVWNTIRSSERLSNTQPLASEINWATLETVENRTSANVAAAAFSLPVGEFSGVIEVVPDEAANAAPSPTPFYIIQVRGREMRPLPENTVREAQIEVLNTWLEGARLSENVQLFERWTERAPARPVLDPELYLDA